MSRLLTLAALVIAGALCAQNQEPAPAAAKKPAAPPFVAKAPLYPLTTCLVSGEDLDAEAVTFTAGGRTFTTCCAKCQKKIEKDVATYARKLDEALIKAQLAHYPLDTCPVSGRKLGAAGEPVKLLFDGTLVQLCCDKCTKQATAQAPAMVQKVREAAYAAQLKTYPLTTCVVSGEKLGDDAVSVMFGTTLVRFCCEKCVPTFEKEPRKYLGKLHPPAKEKEGAEPAKKPGEAGKGDDGKDGAGGCCEGSGCCEGGGGSCCAPKAAPAPAPAKQPK